ncbi:hypothetical protein ILUMI_24636 [Ignelater luminosus]|uniref:Cytochrome P450 n=1 Tax=Ignelater luminosus TaxID=2038154 RepID=A0A8K0G0P8_IGNLU|nr:hypothetical protein ILUMI_24636 [Ignelater luminosus]
MIDMLTSKPKPQDMDICHKKGRILIPDLFYAPILNPLLHMVIGHKVDNRILRELARGILRFLRSSDSTGCALSITPWLRHIAPDIFRYTPIIKEHKHLIDLFLKEIQEHKANFSDDYHADLTDVYLRKIKEVNDDKEDCTTFTEKQLLWTLIDYIFPTPVTIGQTLNYVWAYLLNYPEIQVKIQEEIDIIVGRCRLPNLDDRKNMPYTKAVIRETLRKDPINPLGIPRRCTQDTMLRGYFIPKDTIVLPHLWSAGHDPKIWKDPEDFKPERFLDTNGNLLKKDYTFGFGAGKRVCAGETFSRQVMFLFVSGLLQNFTFRAVDKVPDPQEKIWGMLLGIADVWVEAVSR